MIEGAAPPDCAHDLDLGIARDTRVKPCTKWTWCIEHDGHPGGCFEVLRSPHPVADYGPTRKR